MFSQDIIIILVRPDSNIAALVKYFDASNLAESYIVNVMPCCRRYPKDSL